MRPPPLPQGWALVTEYRDEALIGRLRLKCRGLIAESDGESLSASAVDESLDPEMRCYMELLERIAIVEAERDARAPMLRLVDGSEIGLADRERVFPRSPEGASWTFSRSNGVAAHHNWSAACHAAHLELLERDAVLRSWYGMAGHRHLEMSRKKTGLEELYLPETWLFRNDGLAAVTGHFLFPIDPRHPLVFGFGARADLGDSIEASQREALQRLAFLFEEERPTSAPEFAATPDYHQEYYLQQDATLWIRDWLSRGSRRELTSSPPSKVFFADLGLGDLGAQIHVAKALDETCLPLAFGRGMPWAPEKLRGAVHPIA